MAETVPASRQREAPWSDPAVAPYVRLVEVSKRFGGFTAVDNISLDIYQGEFFSLLGPSGCGKTTLLRMLAGFEMPSYGKILLEGDDLSRVPPYQRPVNMMFQSYALFPHMTVAQNIAFGLKQDRVPREQIQRRVAEVVEMVQLGDFIKRKPHQLSGGQRQRVALARSIVKRPKMLLLDEPLGALDKRLREQTQFELMNIQDELGITFIIVTHDQEEAMTVSSRIAVMDHGRIKQVATPAEIYEYPNSRYVAEFIGDVNILEGRVAAMDRDQVRIRLVDSEVEVHVDHGVETTLGATVWVALRPEKLHIEKNTPAPDEANCLTGEVWDIGYLGNLSIYHVRLPNGKMVTSTHTNQSRLVERDITWEDQVSLRWAPGANVVLTN